LFRPFSFVSYFPLPPISQTTVSCGATVFLLPYLFFVFLWFLWLELPLANILSDISASVVVL
jgi:hypothetical protein